MAFENQVIGSMGTLIYVSNPGNASTTEGLVKYIPRVPAFTTSGISENSPQANLIEAIKTEVAKPDGTGIPGWVRVGGVTDGGTYGGAYELGSEAQLHDGNTMKWKGVTNPGTASLNCLVLPNDPGQMLLKVYAELRAPLAVLYVIGNPSVKVTEFFPTLEMSGWIQDNNAQNGNSVHGNSALMFDFMPGLVMGWETQIGGPNDAIHANPTLEIIAPYYRLERDNECGRIAFQSVPSFNPTDGTPAGNVHVSWKYNA